MFAPYLRAYERVYEAAFRDQLAENVTQGEGAPDIRHVTMVGVNHPMQFSFDGVCEDSIRYRHLMQYLAASGVRLTPDFEVDAVDFMVGRDFLRETHKTDLVIVSCILKESHNGKYIGGEDYLKRISCGADEAVRFDLSTRLSDLHNGLRWAQRLADSGAKMCITFGGTDEINTAYLRPEGNASPYTALIGTPERTIASWTDRYESVESYYGYDNDLPMLFLGVLGQKDWLNEVSKRPNASHDTFLGQRIASYNKQTSGAATKIARRGSSYN